ncbi:hypothetical protein HBE96_12065 [Clostridium sp. P21]|uniref:Uncharacterized protein n=1 Tax=Clostridium muellerianum TaxID=2716538 RepID=A0A7Y0EH66_9CLOT|nr:hypothetical protein [Clostridium muellerianum]NMM63401.1 hypothetical protein [Clostridium muellerianum]
MKSKYNVNKIITTIVIIALAVTIGYVVVKMKSNNKASINTNNEKKTVENTKDTDSNNVNKVDKKKEKDNESKTSVTENNSDLKGFIKERTGDKIIILKTIQKDGITKDIPNAENDPNAKEVIKLNKDTKVILRNIIGGGESHIDKTGSLDDVKRDTFVRVSSEKQEDSIIAKTIIIFTFNK